MRASFLLILLATFAGLFLWVNLSGALFSLGLALLIFCIIVTVGYPDTAMLFYLGAREVKSADGGDFHTAAIQEAYKLAVAPPKLYFYNGTLERAFVLQKNKDISLVLSKDLLDLCTKEELAAICFELLIQVKNNLAMKRTKVMFLVGTASWFSHAIVGLLFKIIPIRDFKISMNWLMHYFLNPWLVLIFKTTLGKKYFLKLDQLIKEYPLENDLLLKLGLKLRKPSEIHSLSSRKMIEFSSANRSRHYQNIITLEFLPHEWDLILDPKAEARA